MFVYKWIGFAQNDRMRRAAICIVALAALLGQAPASGARATGTAPCPPTLALSLHQVVTTPGGRQWALCAGQGSAGSMAKAVYRRMEKSWKRVAWTPMSTRPGHGGIALFGYPLGLAMADDGFGLIWESRGTLYVTRDGGSHWQGRPKVARPEVDFGVSARALPHGVGFVVLAHGAERRLVHTRDAGRTWHVIRRWRRE
jgi:hypothetical protein